VPPDRYCLPAPVRAGSSGMPVDFGKVRAFMSQGASLVLNGVERMTPGMMRVAEILGQRDHGAVGANLYCSWQRHQAFPVHFDTHDVFALQIAGTKAWRIYQRHFKDPIKHTRFTSALGSDFHAKHKGALQMEFVMRPGDLVYVPRGFYHEALATSDASIHVSFSVTPMIGLVVLSHLFDCAFRDAALRAPLPDPARDPAAFDAALGSLALWMRNSLRSGEVRDTLVEKLRGYEFARRRVTLPIRELDD